MSRETTAEKGQGQFRDILLKDMFYLGELGCVVAVLYAVDSVTSGNCPCIVQHVVWCGTGLSKIIEYLVHCVGFQI